MDLLYDPDALDYGVMAMMASYLLKPSHTTHDVRKHNETCLDRR